MESPILNKGYKWLFLGSFVVFLCVFCVHSQNNYKINTAKDYQGRIERLCKQENITLENLVANINSILPIYEAGEKFAYGNRSHTSVKQALRRFNKFLNIIIYNRFIFTKSQE